MRNIVHARLDEETRRLLDRLKRREGWSDSEAVRRAIQTLAGATLERGARAPSVIGIGKFSSGQPDLGSNKKNLDGFGK